MASGWKEDLRWENRSIQARVNKQETAQILCRVLNHRFTNKQLVMKRNSPQQQKTRLKTSSAWHLNIDFLFLLPLSPYFSVPYHSPALGNRRYTWGKISISTLFLPSAATCETDRDEERGLCGVGGVDWGQQQRQEVFPSGISGRTGRPLAAQMGSHLCACLSTHVSLKRSSNNNVPYAHSRFLWIISVSVQLIFNDLCWFWTFFPEFCHVGWTLLLGFIVELGCNSVCVCVERKYTHSRISYKF